MKYIQANPDIHINNSNNNNNKKKYVVTPELLHPLSISYTSFIDISMNFVEKLSKYKGKNIIITIIDQFSKHAHFIAPSHPYWAPGVAQLFMYNVNKLNGLSASSGDVKNPLAVVEYIEDIYDHYRKTEVI